MPDIKNSLKKRVAQGLTTSTHGYFCLELLEEDNLQEISRVMALIKKAGIKTLDVSFCKQIKTNPDKLKEIIHFLPALKETYVEYLDLSCNALHQIGIDELKRMLQSLPGTIKTIVLSGNDWSKLGLDARALVKEIRLVTKKEVLFEGTDDFEHQLTDISSKHEVTNPNRMFQMASKESGAREKSVFGLQAFH